MNGRDLSALYYSADRIETAFQNAVLEELDRALPSACERIAVTTSRLVPGFDKVMCVGGMFGPPSIYRVYRQVLEAAKMASRPFVAFCEDDSLYTPAHFNYRPAPDTFAYNEHRLVLTRKLADDGRRRVAFFYHRPRTQMAQGICSRQLLIETLEEKFAKYPTPPESHDVAKKSGWGEPGRYEKNLKLTPRKIERHKWTAQPNVTINHSSSLMGRRRVQPEDTILDSAEPWGNADDLWRRIHG